MRYKFKGIRELKVEGILLKKILFFNTSYFALRAPSLDEAKKRQSILLPLRIIKRFGRIAR